MDPFKFQFLKLVLITTFAFSYCYCHTDQNELMITIGCSSFDNSTTRINPYRSNIDNVLNTLSENVHLHNGFYKATSGKGKEKIYGMVQCRADISPQDSANCTKMSIQEADSCTQSNQVTIMLTWCFLKYSHLNFFGGWDYDGLSAVTMKAPRFDDFDTVSKGIELMSGLAKTGPKQDLMVQTGIVDVGKHGKRYGMVQCTRDMSRSDCGKCLDVQAKFFRNNIGNYTNSNIFDRGCRMWYNDYQFYSNISTTATNVGKRSCTANEGVVTAMIIGAYVLFSGL